MGQHLLYAPLLPYQGRDLYHVERLDPALLSDWCFLCSVIKAEEVGTTRLQTLRVWRYGVRSSMMLCSVCWVGCRVRFREIPGLIE